MEGGESGAFKPIEKPIVLYDPAARNPYIREYTEKLGKMSLTDGVPIVYEAPPEDDPEPDCIHWEDEL